VDFGRCSGVVVDLVGHRTGLTVGDLLCICGQCPGWSASISWPRQKYYYRYRAVWFIDRNVYWIFRYYFGRAAHDRSSVVLLSFVERSRITRANWYYAISLPMHTNTRLPHPLVPSQWVGKTRVGVYRQANSVAIHTNTRLPHPLVPSPVCEWAVGAGLLMLGLAVALQLIVPDWQWWAEASAFSAICVLSGGLMLRDRARLLSISTVCIAATVILYAEFFHAGTGRLLIVAL